MKIFSTLLICIVAIHSIAQDSPRIETIRKWYYQTMEFQDAGMVDSTEFAEKNSRHPNGQIVALHATFYAYP